MRRRLLLRWARVLQRRISAAMHTEKRHRVQQRRRLLPNQSRWRQRHRRLPQRHVLFYREPLLALYGRFGLLPWIPVCDATHRKRKARAERLLLAERHVVHRLQVQQLLQSAADTAGGPDGHLPVTQLICTHVPALQSSSAQQSVDAPHEPPTGAHAHCPPVQIPEQQSELVVQPSCHCVQQMWAVPHSSRPQHWPTPAIVHALP